ncbi:hypothetical protein [Paenibacillus pinihumi]|uniref:hypothetical protein n=1 Tax=Paenibacillus pinihumi TaxID=669462 RepID=UPI000688848B|nr:hypothetical protein [Paenibacillus pinihumi]
MKLKKLFIAVMVICMLSFSQSAFAITGIGDTRDTAIPISMCPPLTGCQGINLFLSNANDVDWFKWENNTGAARTINVVFQSPSNASYVIGATMMLNNHLYGTLYPKEHSPGQLLAFTYYVPAGATFYAVVEAKTFSSSSDQYTVAFMRIN